MKIELTDKRIEELKDSLKQLIENIEDPTSHYAMFQYTLESCAAARERNLLLFDFELISEEEFRENAEHIRKAKGNAIVKHGEWTISFMERTKTKHTARTLVSSLYNDIFGVDWRGFENS